MIDGKEDEEGGGKGGGGGGGGGGESAAAVDAALSVADGPIPPGRYELVVTSFSGLARYRVGDVVKVVGAFEPPPPQAAPEAGEEGGEGEGEEEKEKDRAATAAAKVEALRGAPVFEFVGRAGSALNLVWEKFDEGAILAAVAEAAAGLGAREVEAWTEFCVREELAPAGGGAPRYVFYLEPTSSFSSSSSSKDGDNDGSKKTSPSSSSFQAWADALQRSLCGHNSIYEMLNSKRQISPLQVSVVSRGTFAALRDAAVALGSAYAQYKTPVVVEADPQVGKRTGLLEARVVATVQAAAPASV